MTVVAAADGEDMWAVLLSDRAAVVHAVGPAWPYTVDFAHCL
jgi:hypothetical protein